MGDFGKLAKKLKKTPRKMRSNLDSEVGDETDAMQNTARRELGDNNSVVSTELLRSIKHRELVRPEHFSTHAVRAEEGRARFLEYGTGYRGEGPYKSPSAKPPVDNILQWIVTKGIQPYAYDSQYALAEAIAEVIQAYGTQPHPFMRPAFRQHRFNYNRRGSYAISKTLRRL